MYITYICDTYRLIWFAKKNEGLYGIKIFIFIFDFKNCHGPGTTKEKKKHIIIMTCSFTIFEVCFVFKKKIAWVGVL